ncbi:Lrp/AsnC family transcriptional regulator [Sphingobium sp.]|uniref:Lrp/AsnC family transcriptional regulator n=1 Tax=Sphingobium sp. TaxID=1912891 RepID=UPI0028BDE3F4|nr:Lrp/AsnC family transcriptional regulator [Sphingobium sp.]
MAKEKNFVLDAHDRRILKELQQDASISISELAERVGLSATPCWTRVRRMQDAGVILRRVALVDRHKIGLGVTVYVAIRCGQHDSKWLERFAEHCSSMPEVVEFYRLSGQVDYLLKVVAQDIEDYDRIYKNIIKIPSISDISSSFAMEQIKYTTELPTQLL